MAFESDLDRTIALREVRTYGKAPPKAMHTKQCIISKSTTCSPPCPGAFAREPKPKDSRVDSGVGSTLTPQEQFLASSPTTTSLHAVSSALETLVGANIKQLEGKASDCASATFNLSTFSACDFATCSAQLGVDPLSLKSLTLKHWTVWWGFGGNDWSHVLDSTTFTRTADGLVATRAARTPKNETCNCSVLQLLGQHDNTFNAAEYRSVESMPDFIEFLHNGQQAKTFVEVGVLFASMLDTHSRRLVQQHVLAGDTCRKCDMPALYLCGNNSTRVSEYDGRVVFSVTGARKT